MARWVKSKQSMRVFKTATTPTVLDGLAIGDLWIDTTTTAVLKVCTAISPVTFSTVTASDASNNFSANNFLSGYTTTATAAGTTTLTVASTQQQFFTGSTTQTVTLPVTSTLVLGQTFEIVNNSSGVVTVQSSGANTVVAMAAATKLTVTCILTSGTTASSWDYVYQPNAVGITGSSSLVRATSPTLVTPVLGAASATSLTFSSTSGIIGTTTNDNAAAGSVGEIISSVVTAQALTTATALDVTSISLTAGHWLVFGNVDFTGDATTRVYLFRGWTSATSATIPAGNLYNSLGYVGAGSVIFANGHTGFSIPTLSYKLSTTTTIYLSATADFDITSASVAGGIYAIRVR